MTIISITPREKAVISQIQDMGYRMFFDKERKTYLLAHTDGRKEILPMIVARGLIDKQLVEVSETGDKTIFKLKPGTTR